MTENTTVLLHSREINLNISYAVLVKYMHAWKIVIYLLAIYEQILYRMLNIIGITITSSMPCFQYGTSSIHQVVRVTKVPVGKMQL